MECGKRTAAESARVLAMFAKLFKLSRGSAAAESGGEVVWGRGIMETTMKSNRQQQGGPVVSLCSEQVQAQASLIPSHL